MYVNAKMIFVESVSGVGGDEMMENGRGDEFMYDIL
jgi:hypothetical protein